MEILKKVNKVNKEELINGVVAITYDYTEEHGICYEDIIAAYEYDGEELWMYKDTSVRKDSRENFKGGFDVFGESCIPYSEDRFFLCKVGENEDLGHILQCDFEFRKELRKLL